MAYKFSMIKLICKGTIRGCENCKDAPVNEIQEGYCKFCGRPLWKNIGDTCNFIHGYYEPDPVERTNIPKLKQGKMHLKCKFCNSMTTIK